MRYYWIDKDCLCVTWSEEKPIPSIKTYETKNQALLGLIKYKYGISDKDISEWFGYKNPMSYYNAKNGKTKIEEGLVKFYEHIKAEASKISDVPE